MRTVAILVLLLLAAGSYAQETLSSGGQVKLRRKEKKEQRETIRQKQFRQTLELISSQQYVLEADFVTNEYGHRIPATLNMSQRYVLEADFLSSQYGLRIPVIGNLNFIRVDSNNVVIQTGSNAGIGYNGVGGLTANGFMTTNKVMQNGKFKSISSEMSVSTSVGNFSIVMNITAAGKATATLTGNSAGKLVLEGRLVSLEESHSYKGSSY